MADRIIAALAVVVAALSFGWTATHDHPSEDCQGPEPGLEHRHCCTDCASAVCVSCCAFYGGCCGS